MDAFVAEHVWEHLSLQEAHRATRNCERHLRPGGRLRIAVPDPAWYSASGGSSPASSEGRQAFIRRGDNRTARVSQTKPSTISGVEESGGRGTGSGRNGGTGDSFGGESGDSSEGGEARKDVSLGGHDGEVGTAGGTTVPAGLDLPGWLSQDMLMTDARDRHLVQFTPELLANVCWSAGLIPFLLEGGGANEKLVVSGENGAAGGPATKASAESGDEDAEVRSAADESDEERKEPNGLRHQKAPLPLAWFPTAGEDDTEEWKQQQQQHRWGHIRRSAAGGDPRGAVSIVMDCVKPTPVGKNGVKGRPESLEADNATGNRPASHDAEGHRKHSQRSGGLTPPKPFSSPPYSASSQQRLPGFGSNPTHAENSQKLIMGADRTEVNRGVVLAGAVAGITSGIVHGSGADVSVSAGVVVLDKGAAVDTAAAAVAAAAVDHLDGSYDRSTSIAVRRVTTRPKEHHKHSNILAGQQGHALGDGGGGGGMGMGVGMAMGSCRGLLCDGGGQSGDAAGSGEGG